MIMIIFIHENDTLQIMADSKQKNPNLRMTAEKHILLISK